MKRFKDYYVPCSISIQGMRDFLETRDCVEINEIKCDSRVRCDNYIFSTQTPKGIQEQYLKHLEGPQIEEFICLG